MNGNASPPNASKEEVYRLAMAIIEGDVSDADARRFESLITADATARGWYVDLICDASSLRRLNRSQTASSHDNEIAQASRPLDSAPVLDLLGDTTHGAIGYFSAGWPVAYLAATVICAIGLAIGGITHVSQPVQVVRHHLPSTFGRGAGGEGGRTADTAESPIVGRITGMVDCRFAEGSGFRVQDSGLPSPASGRGAGGEGRPSPESRAPSPQSPVSLGDKFNIVSGLLEITYDTGAKVILQGPVTYEVESPDGGFLSVGKLTARVESAKPQAASRKPETSNPQSLIPNPLFVVRTPTATVSDLGTEFGVEVARSGETTSHVFRGSIRVQRTGPNGKVEDDGQIVRENQTVRVESSPENRQIVTLNAFTPSRFVREVPKRTIKIFDLVDVVAGGDGFSGRRNRGIDPRNGRIVTNPFDVGNVVGDSRYRRVEGLPFVDGVFVPNGAGGPVRTDSAGHSCDCFLTGVNETSGPVWAGGVVPTTTTSPISAELNGVDYSKPGHGLLSMHANKAVTFDLNAIRRANPKYTLLRFEAVTGGTGGAGGLAGLVDMRVIVDGQARFQRRQVSREHGAFVVSVPIARNDHFLTLAVTDGSDGIGGDGVIFGDPRLEMIRGGTSAAQPRATTGGQKGGTTDKHQ